MELSTIRKTNKQTNKKTMYFFHAAKVERLVEKKSSLTPL